MIQVTRLNNEGFFVNPDLIELIETTPDTVLTLTTGKKIMVCESAPDIIDLIIAFRRKARGYSATAAARVRAAVES